MKTARCGHLIYRVVKAVSLLRFFVAKDQGMTRRHAQWLIVIKKKSNSRRPLTPKAPTQPRPRPPTPKPSIASTSTRLPNQSRKSHLRAHGPSSNNKHRH